MFLLWVFRDPSCRWIPIAISSQGIGIVIVNLIMPGDFIQNHFCFFECGGVD